MREDHCRERTSGVLQALNRRLSKYINNLGRGQIGKPVKISRTTLKGYAVEHNQILNMGLRGSFHLSALARPFVPGQEPRPGPQGGVGLEGHSLCHGGILVRCGSLQPE